MEVAASCGDEELDDVVLVVEVELELDVDVDVELELQFEFELELLMVAGWAAAWLELAPFVAGGGLVEPVTRDESSETFGASA